MAAVATNNLFLRYGRSRNTKNAPRLSYCVFLLILTACAPTVTSTPFIPPASPNDTPTAAVSISFSTPTPQAASPTAPPVSTPETTLTAELVTLTPPCSDSLKFLEDLTYADGTIVTPGQAIEKQWRVANDGSCDWDGRYRLKLLPDYPPLGVAGESALYPARAGTQAVLTLTFSAPLEPGTYRTAWQAYNSQGAAFGDEVYMEIIVQ